MVWQEDVLEALHNFVHVSASLQPVPHEFDLTTDYLQSLMMAVAVALASGFAILMLLALFLCVVISFAPILVWPSWFYRTSVSALTLLFFVLAAKSMDGTADLRLGTRELRRSAASMGEILADVRDHSHALSPAAVDYAVNATHAWKYCLPCTNATAMANATNATKALCAGLGAASEVLLSHVHRVEQPARVGPIQAATLEHVIASSSGWHTYVGLLPLFALGVTAAAIITGAVAGRRNLLLLAQFNAVIVWWMMCAVVSVEFAIGVGLGDACGDPAATVVRVMRQIETPEEASDAKPSDFWYTNLTEHYLVNCETPSPIESELDAMLDYAYALRDQLRGAADEPSYAPATPSDPWCAHPAADMAGALRALSEAANSTLAPTGGRTGCGGEGPIAALFNDTAVPSTCHHIAFGFVELFVFQLAAGAVLLVVSTLLPGLWHSHHLPPRPARRGAACAAL